MIHDLVKGMRFLDIKKVVEEKWGLSNITISKILQKNGERVVYLIEGKEGTFVLKVFHPELTHNEIEKYANALMFLEEIGYCHAPKIIKLIDNSAFTRVEDRYIYLMEFINGVEVSESQEEEYKLGVALAELHKIKGYTHDSNIDVLNNINKMLSRFGEYPFKENYDSIVKNLPDFTKLKQSFIHTDICPTNALKSSNGEIILIDFDDAGNGSTFIDLGYPLITQFVQFQNRVAGQTPPDINKLYFNFEMAKAFYDGYFSVTPMTDDEKKLIFDGAVFMQLMYMPIFGEEAVPYMWRILTYALENKSLLLEAIGVVGV